MILGKRGRTSSAEFEQESDFKTIKMSSSDEQDDTVSKPKSLPQPSEHVLVFHSQSVLCSPHATDVDATRATFYY